MNTNTPKVRARPLPVDLVDGLSGLLYLLPRAPLTPDDCDALSTVLTAWATSAREPDQRANLQTTSQ